MRIHGILDRKDSIMQITETLRNGKRKRVILDTDTYNEIDDQFALALAMLSPKEIELLAVTAAPFHNSNSESYADGMERSYHEIGLVMDLVQKSHGVAPVPYYRGSTERMPNIHTPVQSEAADKIYEIAMSSDETTYVVAIGALTNVSSAIVAHPELADKINVVWLGGNARWYEGGGEFNLQGDLNATNALYASKVPLLTVPCLGVASGLIMTLPEIEYQLRGTSPLGDYLCDNIKNCEPANHPISWSRVIWDISTICCIVDPGCYWCSDQPRFYTDEKYGYHPGQYEGTYEHVEGMHRDRVFSLLYGRLLGK